MLRCILIGLFKWSQVGCVSFRCEITQRFLLRIRTLMGRLMLLLLLNKEVPLAILVFNRESRRFKAIIAIIDHVKAARILIDVLGVVLLLRCRSSR